MNIHSRPTHTEILSSLSMPDCQDRDCAGLNTGRFEFPTDIGSIYRRRRQGAGPRRLLPRGRAWLNFQAGYTAVAAASGNSSYCMLLSKEQQQQQHGPPVKGPVSLCRAYSFRICEVNSILFNIGVLPQCLKVTRSVNYLGFWFDSAKDRSHYFQYGKQAPYLYTGIASGQPVTNCLIILVIMIYGTTAIIFKYVIYMCCIRIIQV